MCAITHGIAVATRELWPLFWAPADLHDVHDALRSSDLSAVRVPPLPSAPEAGHHAVTDPQ